MSAQSQSWSLLSDGVDNGNHPLLLGNTYCAEAVNVSMRSGFPCTRHGFDRQAFTVPARLWQGMGFYASEAGPLLVAAADGRLHRIHLVTGANDRITDYLGENMANIDQMSFCQADRFFLVQDGRNLPVILDGLQYRRSDQSRASKYSISSQPDKRPVEYFKGEIPPSYFMAYGQGRIAMAHRGSNEVLFGDILAIGDPENMLLFTENNYLNEGGSFKLPDHIGEITGMSFMPVAHAANGLGPLVVHGRNGAMTFDISAPRTLWSSQQIASAVYNGAGCLGQRCQVATNRDLYFIAEDGWRSIRQSISNVANEAFDYSMSREINLYNRGNQPDWMRRGSMAYAGKRLFALTCPTADGLFGGLVVADLDLQTTARASSKPAFNGIWTLPEPMVDAVSVNIGGSARLMVATRSADTISFWIENPESVDDSGTPIQARVISRSLAGDGGPIADRQFTGGKVFMERMLPPLAAQASIRIDQAEHWAAPQQLIAIDPVAPGQPSTVQPVTRRGLQIPRGACHQTGASVQVMVEWTGQACLVAGMVEFEANGTDSTTLCGKKTAPDLLTAPTPSPYKLG